MISEGDALAVATLFGLALTALAALVVRVTLKGDDCNGHREGRPSVGHRNDRD